MQEATPKAKGPLRLRPGSRILRWPLRPPRRGRSRIAQPQRAGCQYAIAARLGRRLERRLPCAPPRVLRSRSARSYVQASQPARRNGSVPSVGCRSISWDPKEGSIAPKTRTSQRTTPVPGLLRDHLMDRRLSIEAINNEALVFGVTEASRFRRQLSTGVPIELGQEKGSETSGCTRHDTPTPRS